MTERARKPPVVKQLIALEAKKAEAEKTKRIEAIKKEVERSQL